LVVREYEAFASLDDEGRANASSRLVYIDTVVI
jgi:hypothetical protein